MLGRLIRVLLALTAIAPLSISFAYIYAAKEHNYRFAAIAAFSCVLLGAASLWIIDKAGSRLEQLPIVIQKAKSADKEVIGFFVAYALPLRPSACPALSFHGKKDALAPMNCRSPSRHCRCSQVQLTAACLLQILRQRKKPTPCSPNRRGRQSAA